MRSQTHRPRIILTGGSGFLGGHLLRHDAFKGALAVGRTKPTVDCNFQKLSFVSESEIDAVVNQVDVIVHAAARAHNMEDKGSDAAEKYFDVNTMATLRLAERAARAGVRRFIFLSTIKVLGEETSGNRAFLHTDDLSPVDSYSFSKADAERGLIEISKQYPMEVVIIRPPLVYGAGVKGNFRRMLTLLNTGLPVPLGSIDNNRSLVSVNNLVDLIALCVDHPAAGNQIFLVSDDEDMSTPMLLRRLAKAGGLKLTIFNMPQFLLQILFMIAGKSAEFRRLSRSMSVDISHTKGVLGWEPRFDIDESLKACWTKNCERRL